LSLELTSDSLRVTFSSLGARLVSVFFDGADMVAGGGDDQQFLEGDWTAGAVCGRVAGRIAHAAFTLDGATHELTPNMGPHQLHGGPDNFALRGWKTEEHDNEVKFTLTSPDGDQGFPGELEATARYSVDGSTLMLDLEARTTKSTIVNLTNHAYWNLAGGGSAFDHEMAIHGSQFLPLDDGLLPTGEIKDVAGTRWDFRAMRRVGEAYDNCWPLAGMLSEMQPALTLRDPTSGRMMKVSTTAPAVQMYTANHWDGKMPGRNGPLTQYSAIAVEPQGFPDAPRHANFPSIVLRPAETYRSRMEWRFSRS
jgi:aldose 1-epimerase